VLGFDDTRIFKAFKTAAKQNTYASVLAHTGKRVRHYALSNHKEYFAEGTEAFLYRNDFFPFVRAELQQHDPGLHKLLTEIWGR
jgi:dipeptidyl-peptidase-4